MMGRHVCLHLRKWMYTTDNVRVTRLGRLTEQPALARSVDPRSRVLFAFFSLDVSESMYSKLYEVPGSRDFGKINFCYEHS
jgi:hypothetical protein